MSTNSKIEWTDNTFNPWIGCTKVSPGCDHCYAEGINKRTGGGNWGIGAPRRRTSADYWKQPLRWDAVALQSAYRPWVFCASMADVFDNEVPDQWRADLFDLIARTTNLRWQLLTKRIGNADKMLPPDWASRFGHVGIMATLVNQDEVNRDLPKLLELKRARRVAWIGISAEPLLGSIDLAHIPMSAPDEHTVFRTINALTGVRGHGCKFGYTETSDPVQPHLDWVIAGGESGPSARPADPQWFRDLRDACGTYDVAFFLKQWGAWAPSEDHPRVREELPWVPANCQGMSRVGKKAAGRLLDGVEWNQMPGVAP